jgi:hypothetical protein
MAKSMGACSIISRETWLRHVHAECLEATGDHAAACAAIADVRAIILGIADKIGDPVYRTTFLAVAENRRTLDLASQWLGE